MCNDEFVENYNQKTQGNNPSTITPLNPSTNITNNSSSVTTANNPPTFTIDNNLSKVNVNIPNMVNLNNTSNYQSNNTSSQLNNSNNLLNNTNNQSNNSKNLLNNTKSKSNNEEINSFENKKNNNILKDQSLSEIEKNNKTVSSLVDKEQKYIQSKILNENNNINSSNENSNSISLNENETQNNFNITSNNVWKTTLNKNVSLDTSKLDEKLIIENNNNEKQNIKNLKNQSETFNIITSSSNNYNDDLLSQEIEKKCKSPNKQSEIPIQQKKENEKNKIKINDKGNIKNPNQTTDIKQNDINSFTIENKGQNLINPKNEIIISSTNNSSPGIESINLTNQNSNADTNKKNLSTNKLNKIENKNSSRKNLVQTNNLSTGSKFPTENNNNNIPNDPRNKSEFNSNSTKNISPALEINQGNSVNKQVSGLDKKTYEKIIPLNHDLPNLSNIKSKIDNTLKLPKDIVKEPALEFVNNEELSKKYNQIQKENQDKIKEYKDMVLKMKKEKRNTKEVIFF